MRLAVAHPCPHDQTGRPHSASAVERKQRSLVERKADGRRTKQKDGGRRETRLRCPSAGCGGLSNLIVYRDRVSLHRPERGSHMLESHERMAPASCPASAGRSLQGAPKGRRDPAGTAPVEILPDILYRIGSYLAPRERPRRAAPGTPVPASARRTVEEQEWQVLYAMPLP